VQHTKSLLSLRHIPTLFVNYNRTIENPEESAARLKAFLGGSLDERKMIEVVDPALKRQVSF
ncbi:MAG: hypothetical protein WB564_03365, partial [Dehalococcoidia bacterium]